MRRTALTLYFSLLTIGVSLCFLALFSNAEEPELLLIDTDVGYDDVMAIDMFLVHNMSQYQVLGITIVNGIETRENGTQYVLQILTKTEHVEIPVVEGLTQDPEVFKCQHFFPESYQLPLNGLSLPTNVTKKPLNVSVAQFLVDTVRQHPSKVTILGLGPLTNIAAAIKLGGNDFLSSIKRVVLMFGAVFVPGNAPEKIAEYNVYADICAAQFVFSQPLLKQKISIAPLDVTQYSYAKVLYQKTKDVAASSEGGQMIKDVIKETAETLYYDYLYDPCASLIIQNPSIMNITTLPINVANDGKTYVCKNEDCPQVGVAVYVNSDTWGSYLARLIAR